MTSIGVAETDAGFTAAVPNRATGSSVAAARNRPVGGALVFLGAAPAAGVLARRHLVEAGEVPGELEEPDSPDSPVARSTSALDGGGLSLEQRLLWRALLDELQLLCH